MALREDPAGVTADATTGEPASVVAVIGLLTRQQAALEGGPGPDGLHPVHRLLVDVVCAVADELAAGVRFADEDFVATLTVELAKRYLRAVRDHARGAPVGRAWQVLLDRREVPGIPALRFVLAAVNAVVEHDLAVALVSTCTILGRTPGAVEHLDTERLVAVVAERLRAGVLVAPGGAPPGDPVPDPHALELLVTRNGAWRRAEHLWTLRGRPAAAAAEREAIDWRAGLVGLGLLGDGDAAT